jgi:hypothetical protein
MIMGCGRGGILAAGCCFVVSIVAACSIAASAATDDQPQISPEDYKIYGAVLDLMQFQKHDVRAVISAVTLSFGCGQDAAGTPIQMNGCAGMRMPPATTEQVIQLLHDNWKQLAKSTTDDFAQKNAASTKLQDTIASTMKHKVLPIDDSNAMAGEWHSPDLIICFSRVGMNPQKNEAIVYALVLSYMADVPTEGDYFLFRLNDSNEWKPNGRITYIKMGDS